MDYGNAIGKVFPRLVAIPLAKGYTIYHGNTSILKIPLIPESGLRITERVDLPTGSQPIGIPNGIGVG